MFLGQIVTDYKNIQTNPFIRIVGSGEDIDFSVPTLVVGKENAKRLIKGVELKYLDRKVNDKLYWTFGKTERRDDFERDVKAFSDELLKRLVDGVEYCFVNIFQATYSDIKNLINIIKDTDNRKTVYIHNDTIYIYYCSVVYGLSLRETDYINIERKKIFRLLYSNTANNIMKNRYELSGELNKVLKGKYFLLPYIYFLDKTQSKSKEETI